MPITAKPLARRPCWAPAPRAEGSVEEIRTHWLAADGVVEVNIVKLVKVYLKDHPWPEEPMRLGPASCGGKCRKLHAYAQAVGQPSMLTDDVFYIFIYDRPCNVHESAWDRKKRKEMGLDD